MKTSLVVTTPAPDLQLLSISEMRSAAGVVGMTQDQDLQAHGLKVAAAISAECAVAVGSGAEPTLKRETLTEVFRRVEMDVLPLSRRHDVVIASVTVDDVELNHDEFEVDPESGLLYRLCNDRAARWCARKIEVVYDAGFTTVPSDLKMAATDFFRLSWLEMSRDASVKREEVDIPGVAHTVTDYWVGSIPGQASEGAVPDVVAGQLRRFRNVVL